MYTSFFGLRCHPFNMTPDPACLYLTGQHREAFAGLAYTILSRRGFAVLTGDAGTGKTTLLAKVLGSLPRDLVRTATIFHPTLSTDDFLELMMLDFGFKDVPASKARRLTLLHSFLIETHQQGKIATLIVDEAHMLSTTVLEEIRLLGNFDYVDQKLLQILLVGQTELDEILSRSELRQLKQRVAVRMSIGRLRPADIPAYIHFRWTKAGGAEPLPFSTEIIDEIGVVSKGLPRVINAVCDKALLLAFADESKIVNTKYVRQSAEDLRLTPPGLAGASPNGHTQPAQEAVMTQQISVPAQVIHTDRPVSPSAITPSPIRVPEFSLIAPGRSFLHKLTEKLGFGSL
jgi:general secretion pathway protein A